jgi:hypothetical protein
MTTSHMAAITAIDSSIAVASVRSRLVGVGVSGIGEKGNRRSALFASGRELSGNKRRTTGRHVTMASCRAAVDNDRWIAADDCRNSAVAFFRAGNLIADAGDTLSAGVGSGGTAYHGAAVIRGIANDDESTCHLFKILVLITCINDNL